MDEEMGVINAGESRGVEAPGTLESDIPGKPPPLNVCRLRNLAIASIICGCSCIGILALIYAVKANEKQKAHSQNAAIHWARKSQFMSCLSIGVWLSILILTPLLLVLLSYLISQAE
ncbi:transmembrane protein 265 [Python bivittatus]|uniref:Transmembrane protein 265 n=1 Tax=Python bivittatus TaxID=176946 RepID=A0A9F5N2V0_PYTBI|nr:transmembrane protein 265 [Python bivittatus]